MRPDSMRCRLWASLSLVLILAGCGQAAVQPSSRAQGLAAAGSRPLRLASTPAAVRTQDIDYLQVDGKTFQATIYQPEGPGPFPAILDVHGGAWVREDVRRNEHALFAKAVAAMGIVVAAIDFRQSPHHRYPDSVADVNFGLRWLRANAAKFNASPDLVGALGSSSGGHLVLLNGMRPADPRYAALAVAGVSANRARPDYIIVVYPISDPLARRAYAQRVGNDAPVKATDIYFSSPGSLEDGNPQLILDRRESVTLPPVLLIQGSGDANGAVKDRNVSPEIQQRFAASYRATGGKIQLELLPGAPHNFVNMPGPYADRALTLIRTFVEQQLAGRASGQSSGISAELAPSGKLRTALVGPNPVLVTRHGDGALGGVSVELARFIAERLGVSFEPMLYPDTDSYAKSFGTGQWDIAIGPRTPVAESHSDFSPDFMLVDNIYVAAPGRGFGDASEVDRPGVKIAVVLNGAPDQFLSRTLTSAQLVRISGGSEAMIQALRTGKADVYGSNAENVHKVAAGLPGAKIVPGAFRSVRMAVAFPKARSVTARNQIAEIVNTAKARGLIQKSIEEARLKGVRVAP